MYEEKVIKRRISNRTYPPRYCVKPDCNNEFIPNDARQKYCCEQHRIDANNDKRKIINEIEAGFNRQVKYNKLVMIKIEKSDFYKKSGKVSKSLLLYEGFDFSYFHKQQIDSEINREIIICYDYGLILIDSKNDNYKIVKINK
jgi:hypothetical protein